MTQKKPRNRRPGQQVEFRVDSIRVVASLWMYRGTWVAETTLKGGRYYQQVGKSDLEVIQRLESAIRQRELRMRSVEGPAGRPGAPRPPGPPGGDRRRTGPLPPRLVLPGQPPPAAGRSSVPPAGGPDEPSGTS